MSTTELLLNSRRNQVINGNFRFDQRFASTSAAKISRTGSTNQYMMDRWHYEDNHSTFGTSTCWREAWALGNGLSDSRFYMRQQITGTPSGGTIRRWSHRIEGVRRNADRRVGVSFIAWGDTAFNITVEMRQHFGTGGSPSADVVFGATVLALPTAAGKHELIFNVPSIAGKILGTNNNDYLELRFNLPLNVAISGFNLGDVSVTEDFPLQYNLASAEGEPGELVLCQRYYEKSWDVDTAVGAINRLGANRVIGATSLGTAYGLDTSFKVRKRAIPAFRYYAPDSGAIDNITISASNVANAAADHLGEAGTTDEVAGTSNSNAFWHWTSDAEL